MQAVCRYRRYDSLFVRMPCPVPRLHKILPYVGTRKVVKLFGHYNWNRIRANKCIHVQAIFDIKQCFAFGLISYLSRGAHLDVEQSSMMFCHVLHARRMSILGDQRVYGDHSHSTGNVPGGLTERMKIHRKV